MLAQLGFLPLSKVPVDAVDALLDAAFGVDRHQRTAYRVRQGMTWIPHVSFAAIGEESQLLGLIQCWPVSLLADDGRCFDMIMVGPVAVHPDHQGQGIGSHLMDEAMRIADHDEALCNLPMMMIGDADFYRRWEFTADATRHWRLDGPFDSARLLARKTSTLATNMAGLVQPRTLPR